MPEYGKPSKGDKIVPIVCGVVLLAFFACLPSMIRDEQKIQDQLWKDHGCQMYDDYKPANVPAKCSSYFIDHYQPQNSRPQPPDEAQQ